MIVSPPASRFVHHYRFALLGLILLIAAGLRLNHLNSEGFWFDEFCSLSSANGWGLQFCVLPGWGIVPDEPKYAHWSSARPLGDVIPAIAASDDHPPLYFLSLRGWEASFGDSEIATRLLSVFASLVAIALVYAIARERHDSTVALAACAIMAVAGPQIEYAQQTRHYVFLMLFSLGVIWIVQRIENRGPSKKRFIGLMLLTLGALLTHYLIIAVVAAVAFYALVFLRERSRIGVLLAIAVAGALFAIAWGPMLLRQLPTISGGHDWMIDSNPGRLHRLGMTLLQLPGRFLIEPDFSSSVNRLVMASGCLWLALPLALWRRDTRLWAIWLIAVVGLIAGSDLHQHTAQLPLIRFTLAATPALYLLLAAMVRGKWWWVAPAAAVLLEATNLPMAYDPPWKNDLRPGALLINKEMQTDDALVFVSPDDNGRRLVQWAHQYEHYLTKSPKIIAMLHDPADENALQQLRNCRHIWVVWPMQNRPVGSVIPGFKLVSDRPLPAMMELYEGTAQTPPPSTRR